MGGRARTLSRYRARRWSRKAPPALAALLFTALLLPAAGGAASPPGPATLVHPMVEACTSWAVTSAAPATSNSFVSLPGDTIVVFVELMGPNHVTAVSDSAGDRFVQLLTSFQAVTSSSGSVIQQGFALWDAVNVSGGSLSVTVSASGTAPASDPIALVDVTGVGPSPFDAVGTPSNSTSVGGQTRSSNSSVLASPNDLVLSAVASRYYDQWTPTSPATTLLNDSVSPVARAYNSIADVVSVSPLGGRVATNATSNRTAPWIAESLALAPGAPYRAPTNFAIAFSEVGLPNGTNWSVTVGGTTVSGLAPANLSLAEPNGTYGFHVGSVEGYVTNQSSGTFVVNGSGVGRGIVFGPAPKVTVAFYETGLPAAMNWTVRLNGTAGSNQTPGPVVFRVPGGSYAYTIDPEPGYTVLGDPGRVTVGNGSTNVTVAWSVDYPVVVTETGLSAGRAWGVTVGNQTSSNVTQNSTVLWEPNGTYAIEVTPLSGYTFTLSSPSVAVGGSGANVSLTFVRFVAVYPVHFVESGLLSGVNWSVTLNGSTLFGLAPSSFQFAAPNGTYPFSVSLPDGYSTSLPAGNVTINGDGARVAVPYVLLYRVAPGSNIQHVVLVMLENQELSNVWAMAPYQSYLLNAFGNATNFYPTCHSSTALYMAVTSGASYGCNFTGVTSAYNLADLLEAHNLTWSGYMEGMPAPCDTSSTGTYLAFHNPFVHYADIVENTSRCDAHVVNSSQFNESVANGTLPNFAFYVPNYVDDGHGPAPPNNWNATTGMPYIDAWLRGFLPPILNHTGAYASSAEQAMMNHTAFILLYDEGTTNLGYTEDGLYTQGCYKFHPQGATTCGGHTAFTVISPYSLHSAYTGDATTYSVTSTIEWLFALPSMGGWDGSQYFPALTTLFSFTDNGYSTVAHGPSVRADLPAAVGWAAVAAVVGGPTLALLAVVVGRRRRR